MASRAERWALRARVAGSLEGEWRNAELSSDLPHRRLQQTAEAACYWQLLQQPDGEGARPARDTAHRALEALAGQQDPATGLFTVGDNVLSPPDTSFSINGLARLALVLRSTGAVDEPFDGIGERVTLLVGRAARTLRVGGVHTPNHRWEIASALARAAVVLDDPTLIARAQQWLAEGVDAQPDGLYSERSPNYAVHVSNPSLIVLARLLGRPDLLEVVHRNLHAHALLTGPDGNVLTLQSRRQDQLHPFSVAGFEHGFLTASQEFDCNLCASMARRCDEAGGGDPVEIAASLLDGSLAEPAAVAPAPDPPAGWHDLPESELAIFRGDDEEVVVRAASDVARAGRVCSGVNHNPTFASYRNGGLEISGFRLSRSFFGLGPFRAQQISRDGDLVRLDETESAAYYQPLAGGNLRADGDYALTFDGRFAAKMAFDRRDRDEVALSTTVAVERLTDGLAVAVECAGPAVPLSLELAIATPGAELTGAVATSEPELWAATGVVGIRTPDGSLWEIRPEVASLSDRVFYEPGEAVRYSGGSDAARGPRLAFAWRSDDRLELRIRRLPR